MKTLVNHYGVIKNGKKYYFNPKLYEDNMRMLEGQQFVETIKKVHKKPSVSTYNYYFGGVLATCHTTEMFSHLDKKEDIHTDYFGPKFLAYKKLVNIGGQNKEIWILPSLADINQEAFSEFIEKCKIECAMLGIIVLEPDQYYNKYYHDREK